MAYSDVRPSVTDEPEMHRGRVEGSTAMARYERTKYFERLVELHLLYAMRGEDDRTSVLSIDEAIAWAEAQLTAPASDLPDATAKPN